MRAVILAGGRGTRLRPFTTSFPKPLMPVGDMPILEILLRQLKSHGVTEVTLLTGHLAYLLEGYFEDGHRWGLKVDYLREERPLGTAGPLRQLAGSLVDDFFVMNGDLLTDLDFTSLMAQHRNAGAPVTVSVYSRPEKIDLGILQLDADGDVIGYDEKPTLKLDVSMGAYAMSPAALAEIPEGPYDMPQLILDLLGKGRRVTSRRHEGFWLDIGRVDDYSLANRMFTENPAGFLPPA
ncbi:nucleotidyltransferase family protein [Micromonospora peucetia]|uniref:Nucleotidyl transferase n=1 Tax=Micromonospora peucetia TaxID=47871 RepID=A0A1C6UAM3_9ACTN|nr:nucleotidyltransferase family protein [Micromonospora peucetia]MCX4386387.1 nucleotidyltransferase family protein [Micromonospora peucetia]WSA33728.1 nucleotidyltransferase family protein [Micromonospora peucetia]SCL51066.1 Nucleotidyl transferase [Micromonospora peucetia]